jgi:basic amino acid/polyamine antiporter, APA family
MTFVRSIGRVGLTALAVNIIIGGGIFGLPSEIAGLVGRASPLAMILAGLLMGVIMACFAEVASQFSEHGGAYLYIGRAFGPYAGLLAGWFTWLTTIGAAAANVTLFVVYGGEFFPAATSHAGRAIALLFMVAVATVVNYVGVRTGTRFSILMAVAKLLPLFALIAFGLARFGAHPELLSQQEIVRPGAARWLDALLLLVFAYGGFEDSLIPMGEVANPRKTVPMALGSAFAICVGVYTLLQFIVVTTLGTAPSERPLAAAGAVLIGPASALLISVGAMIATYGNFSGVVLASPRLMYALAENGQFPRFLESVHERFKTPHRAIVVFGMLTALVAITGTFRWALLITTGSTIFVYGGVCAALIRLRRVNPEARGFRLPVGVPLAMVGIAMSLAVMTRLHWRESIVFLVTALCATAMWVVARHRRGEEAKSMVRAR